MRKKQIGFIAIFAIVMSVFLSNVIYSFAQTDSNVIAQPQIYVHDFKINNTDISVGGDISGFFRLSNIGSVDVSDAYYTVSILKTESDNLMFDAYNETNLKSLEYIKANSKRDVAFNYSLPKYLVGDNYLLVKIYLQDGTMLASGVEKLYIKGEPAVRLLENIFSVLVNDKKIANSNEFVFSQKDNVSIIVSPKDESIKQKVSTIIHKEGWGGSIVNEPSELDLTLDKSGNYKIDLPAGLNPGKYLAEIKFTSLDKSSEVRTILLNYVVNGLTSGIETINIDPLSVSKGDDFNLIVRYKGYGPSDESDIQKKIQGAVLSLIISNEKEETVSEINSPIDLSVYSGKMELTSNANTDADSLSIFAEIRDANGDVINSYTTDLLSEKELKTLYPSKVQTWKIILNIAILIILIVLILWLKKRSFSGMKNFTPTSVLMLSLGLIVLSMPNFSFAYTENAVSTTPLAGYNLISSVSSPLPSNVSSYAPGQSFKLSVNLQKIRVDNGGWSRLEYMSFAYVLPSSNNWVDWNDDSINKDSGTQVDSSSYQITSSVTYTAPVTPGLYNFNFYLIGKKLSAPKGTEMYVIKKITQPILVEIPYNQILGSGKNKTSDLNLASSCSNEHQDGQRVCDFGNVGVWRCMPAIGNCVIDSVAVTGSKMISTGNALDSFSGLQNAEISVNQNVNNIKSGDKFYIITDLLNSSWINKQYVYSEFIYGKPSQNFVKQGTRKSNEHVVAYDGANKVTVTSKYSGKDSNFTTARFSVREIGLVNTTSCRNIIASEISKMFVSGNAISTISMCTNPKYVLFSNSTRLDDLYTSAQGGSHSKGSLASMSMNVCDSSEVKNLENNKPFYVVVDSNGTDWISTRYDFFNFTKGIAKTQTFYTPSKKYNVITGQYDGACSVTFNSKHAGKDSNYTRAVVNIIEIGLMNSDLCYNPSVNYPQNFNRGNSVPSIPACRNSLNTCATNSNWMLQPTEEGCSSFLSCLIKNSSGNKISALNAGDIINYDADYATTGDKSLFQYSWDFGSTEDANPTISNTKTGTLTYSIPGQKNINLKVSLNNEVLEETTCSPLTVNCESGNCSAGCGISIVGQDEGLTASNSKLCPSGQTLSPSTFTLLGASGNSKTVWSWKCKSNTNERSCSAKCADGLTYCPETGVCSLGGCGGDMCSSIDGMQSVTDPVYAILGCANPKLKLKLGFNKPYADEKTLKCSINWKTETTPDSAKPYTKCELDGKAVDADNASYNNVSVGKHKMVCVTTVSAEPTKENPRPQSVSSNIEEIDFACSRARSTTEE